MGLPGWDSAPRNGQPALHATADVPPRRCFAVQDYLALAGHPALRRAADAILHDRAHGPSVILPDSSPTAPVLALERRIAAFLSLGCAVAYPSGTEAVRRIFRALLAPQDSVIVDSGAVLAMSETVLATGARLLRSPPGSVEGVERRLRRLSVASGPGRIWVAVPAISPYGSTMADLAALSAVCRQHGAGLIVDVTHDLGSMAPGGGGVMEIQGIQGCADIVVGSFAECFGAPGGFAAFQDQRLKDRLRAGRVQAKALSPAFAATILAALDIAESSEGSRLRRRLHANTLRLRNHLMADGVPVLGHPSPLVPVRLPKTSALARTELVESAGVAVTLLQSPHVAARAPRWRLELNARHSLADIDDLADLVRDVTRIFDRRARQASL